MKKNKNLSPVVPSKISPCEQRNTGAAHDTSEYSGIDGCGKK